MSAEGRSETRDGESAFRDSVDAWGTGGDAMPPAGRTVRRSGSRLVPVLLVVCAYVFAYWAFAMTRSGRPMPAGYEYMLVLVGVPFLLAAHGFAVVRWSQLRRLDEVQGTVRDVATDLALSVWEILFCWLGISASLMFLYYAAPAAELKDWYPRFFLVLVVFFGATYQKALVFVFALLPFVVTLTGLSLWVYGVHEPGALGADFETPVALGMLAADVALLWWAVRLTRRHGGFRVCEFQMPFGAGSPGGHLAGVIRTRQKTMPAGGFHLHLSCLQLYKEGDKRRHGQVLWHAQKIVQGDLPGARHTDTSVPVAFSIPEGAPATIAGDEDNRVTWTLRATAALPESDFRCIFDVPVRYADDPDLLRPPLALVNAVGAQTPALQPEGREEPDGVAFQFRTSWNHATELVTVANFVFWFQLVWLATSHQIGWETWGMFGAGLWFLGWAMIPWTSSTKVTVVESEGAIKVTNRRSCIERHTVVLFSELEDIIVKPSSYRTGLMEGLDYYHLELRRTNGSPVTLGRHLRDRGQAGMLAHTIKEIIAGAG